MAWSYPGGSVVVHEQCTLRRTKSHNFFKSVIKWEGKCHYSYCYAHPHAAYQESANDTTEMMKLVNHRIRSGHIPAAIALMMLLLFVTPVMADEWVGGIPLKTIESGVVSGGLYHDAAFGFNSAGPNGTISDGGKTVEKVFTLPPHTGVQWAQLYVAVYCGNMKENRQANLEIQFGGDGDSSYSQTWNEHLDTEYGFPGEGGSGPVDLDNGSRVTGDYLYWYDVKDMIRDTSVKALVKTSKPEGYTGTFDGRIKLVALVFAYEDGSTDQVHYWINQGHDVASGNDPGYIGKTSFDISGLGEVDPDSAELTIFHMASANADMWINGKSVTGTSPQGSYSGSNQWDVLDQIGESSINFEYQNAVGYYKLPLAFLSVQCSNEPSGLLPDLTIAGTVNPVPSTAVFAREPNLVRITNIKNAGPGAATNIPVALYASDIDATIPVNTTIIGALESGAQTTVTLIDPTIRDLEGGTVTYTVVIDPGNTIDEVDKTNNNEISIAKPVRYNGYKGKGIYWEAGSNITTKQIYDLRGDIAYTTQPESAYKAAGWTTRTETWTADDLSVPAGAEIEGALLYIAYNWDQTPGNVPDVTATFNDAQLTFGTPYTDKINFGGYADCKYGLYPAINVTNLFALDGDNTLVMTANAGNKQALYPSTLAIIYSDPTATRKRIIINEECDLLAYSESSYGTSMEEATAYVPFPDVEAVNVQKATLHSFAGSAGPSEGNLLFNGDTVATSAWKGTANTCEAFVADVTAHLTATGNEAAVQSTDSGGMCACHQFLVIEYTNGATALPDLIISAITPNAGAGDLMFANEPNVISVTVKNQGEADAGSSALAIEIDGTVYTEEVGTLAPGAGKTVIITHETEYAHGASVSVTATADSGDEVDEGDEANNALSLDLSVYDNGYKGKRWTPTLGGDMATQATFDGRYGLVYSHGDSTYKGAKWPEQTVTWSADDLLIPEGATITDARLYQSWGWNKMTEDPAPSVVFNDIDVEAPVATYKDRKNWGTYDYPYGLYVYSVTDQFDAAGNTLTITPEADNDYFLYGAYLVVVYEDPATTEKRILINEEFDMVCSRASYSVDDEEATVYAPFSGVNTTDLAGAQVIAVLASADEKEKSKFFFNDQEYPGFWEDYQSAQQIGFSVYDVAGALQDGANEARLQSFDAGANGDNMYALTAILIAEYTETTLPDLVVTGIAPNAGEIFAHEPNNITATVANIGDAAAGTFDLKFAINSDTTVVSIAGLAANATTTVEITDPVIRSFDDVVTITVTADAADAVLEADETNNTATVTKTVVYNGYKGKRYTDGDDLTTRASFSGRYDIAYSAGDTAYSGASWTEQTKTWTADDLPIPTGATVVSARLYQGYSYNKMEDDPAFTLSFNDNVVTPSATYSDIKSFGSYSYPYGMYVYDVTEEFDPAGNSMKLTPEAENNYAIYGAYLVVVYEDASATRKTILINDEFDMLYAYPTYAATSDEATAYAPFTNVDTDDILSARAVAILYSAGDAGKSKFFFNDQEYAGFWTDYQADPQLGFSVYDVTGALQDGANEARLQSYDPGTSGDNMYAATVILVVTSLPQGDQTTDVSLEIPGCNVTTGDDGKSRVRIDISGAQVAGTTITIPQEAYTLTIETDEVPAKDEGGTITGTVTKIRLDTKPIVTKLDTVGAVNASISASLTHLPAEASLTTTVSQDVAPDARSAFQLAASDSGLNLIDVAYTLSIVRTKLENTRDIADATIRMSVSPGWVADHAGDASMVRIIRFADDGTHEILTTRLTGTDASGNLIFEANSPNGFSVFGLASVSAPSQPTQSRSSSGGGSGTLTSVGAASNLKVGDRAVISMDRTAVSAITFTAKNPIKDVMVTMAKGSLPRDAKPPAGTVYQYIEATLYRAAEEDLSTVQFRFAVPTDWLAAQSCTKDGVEFFRLTDDGWQEVSIEVLGEENGNAIFTANPEGFSLFAITATGKSPGATEPTQESTGTVTTPPADVTTPPAGTTTPTTPPPTPFPAWVAVMALGVSLLLVRRRA